MRFFLLLITLLSTCVSTIADANGYSPSFSHKLDVQIRYDDRSNRPSREQYRLRYYPSIALSPSLSVHSFIVTGEDFSSSHNTFGSDSTDYLYPRRLYVRHKTDFGNVLSDC